MRTNALPLHNRWRKYATGPPIRMIWNTGCDKDGKWVWIHCRGRVSRDENGEAELFAGIITKPKELKPRIEYPWFFTADYLCGGARSAVIQKAGTNMRRFVSPTFRSRFFIERRDIEHVQDPQFIRNF